MVYCLVCIWQFLRTFTVRQVLLCCCYSPFSPVYMQYMLPPIKLRGNGHNTCSSCKQKIQKCPTCREPQLDTRNKALEKLAVRVECPCPNEPHGCTLTFPIVPYVDTRTCVNTVLQYVLYDSWLTADGRGIYRKLKIT